MLSMEMHNVISIMSVGVGRMFESVCLFVCLFVCCPQHNSKTNNPKLFKVDGVG